MDRPLMGDTVSAARTVTLQFDDNALLPLLYGEHDRHLAQIEQRAGVRLASRGNRLTITGSNEASGVAEAALRALWKRLERGDPIGIAEVEAALRLSEGAARAAQAEGAEPRLPLPDLPAIRTRKGAIGPRSPAQAGYMDMLQRHEMVFGIGPAGTGKTYLAVAQGVALLMAGRVDRIVLSRPAVEAGERLGFLPGDMKEKVDPYLRPLYDALHDMMPADQVARRIASGEIEIAPLAFMRGRTLAHCFAILDEAQNTTPAQIKMFLTRMGEGTRMVVTGDPSQVDLPPGQKSGLVEALNVLGGVPGIGITRFAEQDVVRHPLVARIVAAYNRADEQGETSQKAGRVVRRGGDGPPRQEGE
ncbi:PhoH family protein [Pseudoroseomonas ludipueritiae]|uniref:PhoH-like protein n=1 Tax=Pseudoroseomonas ludipueritiae TaxID=198093 RepID=A0ABR7R7R4_9PROT|nr:PhoH family protein [Pseudoroseomonas ludipueritiae]MBC9177702.1 PhoH family protein [Pseudoroseomonas ludipueritiae]MCG7361788.1 PhoH family protein [Roseomonas sp. ACRSG]